MSDERQRDPRPSITLTIKDLPTMSMHLAVSDNMPSIDYALNMLAQATRMLEAERRKQEAREWAQEMQEQQRVSRLITRPQ